MTESASPQLPALPKNVRDLTRETNIELVRKLAIRGISKTMEIQAYFKRQSPPVEVTDRTIARYKVILKRRSAHALIEKEDLRKPIEELAIELKDDYEELQKELWVIVHNPDSSPRDRVSALSEIRKISDSWLDRLQSLGFAFKAPEKHQLVDANGLPIDPPAAEVNIEQLNVAFTSFVKAKFQDPIGQTNDHTIVERTPPSAVATQPPQTP